MKKLVFLVAVFVVLCSLPAFAKATYSFESAGDELNFVAAEGYFPLERSSDTASSGDYALRVILTDTTAAGRGGTGWNVYTAGYETDSLHQNITFNDDTLFVYMYLPDVGTGVMNNIQPFTQDDAWLWNGNQQAWDPLPKDQWTCYWAVIADVDWESNPRTLPIKRSGVQFESIDSTPNCTLYIDYISTWGRDVSGIELMTDPGKVTFGPSINNIKFTIDEPTPVLISVYNLMGAKVSEVAPGRLDAGSHEFSANLPNGMYIVKILAGQVRRLENF
jgi:hypothetical protein